LLFEHSGAHYASALQTLSAAFWVWLLLGKRQSGMQIVALGLLLISGKQSVDMFGKPMRASRKLTDVFCVCGQLLF
jgi:hypothetical protein